MRSLAGKGSGVEPRVGSRRRPPSPNSSPQRGKLWTVTGEESGDKSPHSKERNVARRGTRDAPLNGYRSASSVRHAISDRGEKVYLLLRLLVQYLYAIEKVTNGSISVYG